MTRYFVNVTKCGLVGVKRKFRHQLQILTAEFVVDLGSCWRWKKGSRRLFVCLFVCYH